MSVLFFILISIPIIYVINAKRKLDYLLVAVLSTFVYYFPALIGCLRVSSYSDATVPIQTGVYLSVFAYVIVMTIFIFITDKYKIKIGYRKVFKEQPLIPKTVEKDVTTNISVLCVEIIGILLLLYSLKNNSGFSDGFNKMLLLASGNRFTEYLKYIALFTFVYSFINSGRFINLCRGFSLILIGYTFMLGHRSFIFLGFIGVIVYHLQKVGSIRLITYIKSHLFMSIAVLLICFFFLFIKGVFAALITGQMDLVISRLTDPKYYINTLLVSESNSIMYNLQNVCETGMKYSVFQYLLGLILLIPGIGGTLGDVFGYTSFETELNLRFNDRLSEGVGLGSTFLGEAYSLGGILAVVIITTIFMWILIWLVRKSENSDNGLNVAFMSVILPYLTFYVHRNSVIFLLVTIRAYFYIYCLIFVIRICVRRCVGMSNTVMIN